MFELGIRLVIAAGIFTASTAFGAPSPDVAWKVSLATVALGLIGARFESKNALNEGVSGLLAVMDAFLIATLLGSAGLLASLGFLALFPIMDAALRRNANAISMSPIASASLFAAYGMFPKNATSPDIVMAQAAGVMATGLLFGALKTKAPRARSDQSAFALVQTTDGLIEIRESYRNLKKAYQDLEKRTRKPVRLAELEEIRPQRREEFFQSLARKLASIADVESVGVYSMAQVENSMVIRGSSGDYGKKLSSAALTVKVNSALNLIRMQTKQALEALRDTGDARRVANVLLTETTGRVVAMLCLISKDEDRLEEGRSRLEELAPSLASIIVDYTRREAFQRRANQAELLYETACVTHGAVTTEALAQRVVQQLWDLSEVDYVGLTLGEGDKWKTVAAKGAKFHLLEAMIFSEGTGLDGWRGQGCPELAAFDVRSDPRFSSAQCLKQRLGSMCLIPITEKGSVIGHLAMATHRSGGVDAAEIETLRIVAMELGRAIAQLKTKEEVSDGLMAPTEFLGFVSENPAGCLILLEPLKLERLEDMFGRPALNHALRQLSTRLRTKLPSGGALCRKPEGSFVAYLPGANMDQAARWANDGAAVASMIGLRTPDGSSRIPLGLRARVAQINRQEDEILTAEAS